MTVFDRLREFFTHEPTRMEDRVQLRHEGTRVVYCGDCGHSPNIFDVCQWCGGFAVPVRGRVLPWERK